MTAPAGQFPCRDCETGACPCGTTCEGCDFTGDCSSCRGTGFVEVPPRPIGGPKLSSGSTGKKWGRKRPMDPCFGCGRAHRCDKGYYRMTPDEVLRKVLDSPALCHRPRCTICCVPFGNTLSPWYQIALSRHCVTEGAPQEVG